MENKDWIYDYALFMSLKFANKGKAWYEWDEPLKMYKPKAIKSARKEYANDIDFWCFVQYKYFQQWKKLKAYANEKGIEIIGDIPIYVAYDSVEVWSTPQYFSLDKEKSLLRWQDVHLTHSRQTVSFGATLFTTGNT